MVPMNGFSHLIIIEVHGTGIFKFTFYRVFPKKSMLHVKSK